MGTELVFELPTLGPPAVLVYIEKPEICGLRYLHDFGHFGAPGPPRRKLAGEVRGEGAS